MTAVVAILNKSGVALAADSAVTTTGPNGHKIFNNAHKLFTLSKFHPVGVMIYNSASFLDIPWETLIKTHRANLGNRSFGTLMEYKVDFINYLTLNTHLVSSNIEKVFFLDLVSGVIRSLESQVEKNAKENSIGNDPDGERWRNEKFIEIILENLLHLDKGTYEKLPGFDGYVYEDFFNKYAPILEMDVKPVIAPRGLSKDDFEKLYRVIHHAITGKFTLGNAYSGLVFAGFGDNQIFPGCISIYVNGLVDGKIRYYIDDAGCADLNDGHSQAAIRPFAQRDVIDGFITGTAEKLDKTYMKVFEDFLNSYDAHVFNELNAIDPNIANKITRIDVQGFMQHLSARILDVKNVEHIQPTMDSVGTLSKKDLSEMAEALIYLTFLKRRISFAEESVGGPVDVAVISKGDGFIWIKRKHYFDIAINDNFKRNYFT